MDLKHKIEDIGYTEMRQLQIKKIKKKKNHINRRSSMRGK